MPTFRFHKLVRDKFPEIYAALGQTITARRLTDVEYRQALRDKIIEEAKELSIVDVTGSMAVDELADLRQTLDDLCKAYKVSAEQVTARQAEKFTEKGGFENGLFVETITLQDGDKWIDYYRAEPDKYPEIE